MMTSIPDLENNEESTRVSDQILSTLAMWCHFYKILSHKFPLNEPHIRLV
jgi:hypothetical protein